MMDTSPLSNSTFRRLFAAQVTSLLGAGLATVALALLAYDLAGGNAGLILGTALAIKMVAYVTVAPIAGVFAQRVPRRTLLISLDVSRAAIVCLLPLVTAVWQVYVLIFLLSACSAAFTPTYQATIPEILPDDDQYTRALSLSRLAYDLESLFSPAMAALALAFLTYDALFIANAVTFTLSALILLTVRFPDIQPFDEEGDLWAETTAGIRAYLATPRLRGLFALSFGLACGGAMVIVNTVVYAREFLGGSDSDTAMVLAFFGGGSMIVALLLPRVLLHFRDRSMMLTGCLLMAGTLLAALTMPGWTGVFVIWFLLGAGGSMIQTPAGRLLKASSNHDNRPAIYSAQFALSHACWLIAYPLAGLAGSFLGLQATFGIMSFLTFVALAVAYYVWEPGDDILEHTHAEITHEHVHVSDAHHQHAHEGWEGPEPHRHAHRHEAVTHRHRFVIDRHHLVWPQS